MVKRKTLVLDLDETLIHSHHDGVIRQPINPKTPPDFVLKVHNTSEATSMPLRSFINVNVHLTSINC